MHKSQKRAKDDSGDLAWQPFEQKVIQTYAKALGFLNGVATAEDAAKSLEALRDEETKQE